MGVSTMQRNAIVICLMLIGVAKGRSIPHENPEKIPSKDLEKRSPAEDEDDYGSRYDPDDTHEFPSVHQNIHDQFPGHGDCFGDCNPGVRTMKETQNANQTMNKDDSDNNGDKSVRIAVELKPLN